MNIDSKNKKLKGKEVKGLFTNISAYARDNNISWATAAKKLKGIKRKTRTVTKKKILDDYTSIIDYKLEEYNCTATSLFCLINEKGYSGSKSSVIKYVQKKKDDIKIKAVLRVETSPGLQAQVDWKERLHLISKNKEEYVVNIFLYVLSYSKYKYIELTVDRTQPTLFRCMVNAFKNCGGVPTEIWFDNMKSVVEYHDINSNEVKFNDKFFEFSKNAMFKPIACKPYRPCTKGIAENLAKIMDRLKAFNEEFNDYDELNTIVVKLNEDLNNEICQATNEKPIDRFIAKEKEYLTRINYDQFNFKKKLVRKVSVESMVEYNNAKYSVPVEFIKMLVEIEAINNKLYIYYNQKEISCHQIAARNTINYRENDLRPILRQTFKSATNEEIEKMCKDRLKKLDFVNREKKVSKNEK